MERPLFQIRELAFTGGDRAHVADARVVVLVGPNNAGKSMALREIVQLLDRRDPEVVRRTPVAIDDLSMEKLASGEEVAAWLREHYEVRERDGQAPAVQRASGSEFLAIGNPSSFWEHRPAHVLGPKLTAYLVELMAPGERLNRVGATGRPRTGQAHGDNPVQEVFLHPTMRDELGTAIREVFRMELVFDGFGENLALRVGREFSQQDFETVTNTGLVEREVSDRVAAIPTVEEQGDGVKSFVGILLSLLAGDLPLLLIDEPEAFLHPPQARRLGKYLAGRPTPGQRIVATHSIDILLGLLEAAPGDVMIIRLDRPGKATCARLLDADAVGELWSDPLLRYSRALDALFHEATVICEGDADAYFYSHVTRLLETGESGELDAIVPDLHFTYTAGKDRMAMLARALVAVGVPVVVCCDFDILRERVTLDRLLGALGSSMSKEMDRDHRMLLAALDDQDPCKWNDLMELVDGHREDASRYLSDEEKREVILTARGSSAWSAAKEHGLDAVKGEQHEAARRLVDALKEAGIFVVPVGELEGFVRSVGGHGPSWVADVVAGDRVATAGQAHEYVREVIHGARRRRDLLATRGPD